MTMNLSKRAKVSSAITSAAGVAAQTAINASILDMSGFGGVLFKLRTGDITASAVTSVKMQQGDQSDMSDAEDLLGTNIAIADDDDDQIFSIDLYRPEKRYIRAVVTRGTADAVIAGGDYTQYEPSLMPTTQPTGVTMETHVSPIAGTP